MAPSSSRKSEKPLRQLATEKIHGKGSNPSQLGDPISLKAEESANQYTSTKGSQSDKAEAIRSVQDLAPTEGERPSQDSTSDTKDAQSSSGEGYGKTMKDGRTLKGMMKDKIEQAEKGEGNPTMLGDPTSLKAETSKGDDPVDHDNGPSGGPGSGQRRSSKL